MLCSSALFHSQRHVTTIWIECKHVARVAATEHRQAVRGESSEDIARGGGGTRGTSANPHSIGRGLGAGERHLFAQTCQLPATAAHNATTCKRFTFPTLTTGPRETPKLTSAQCLLGV